MTTGCLVPIIEGNERRPAGGRHARDGRANVRSQQTYPPVAPVSGDGAVPYPGRVEDAHRTRLHRDLPGDPGAGTGNWSPPAQRHVHVQGGPHVADTAPQALVEGLDFDKMKQDRSWLSSTTGPAQRQIDLFRMGFARVLEPKGYTVW